MARPVLVFDVNETLLDIDALAPLFVRLFGDAAVLREWFAQLVLHSQALSLAGRYVPFGDLGAAALRMTGTVHDRAIETADIDELAERTGSLPAHPDAEPALARLADAGFRLVTLTNSPSTDGPGALERAGLARHFERTFTVDPARRFKPAPETYALVADALGIGPEGACMIAAHSWDTLGAQAFGWHAVLLTRGVNAPLVADGVPPPDIAAADLEQAAERIVARWPG